MTASAKPGEGLLHYASMTDEDEIESRSPTEERRASIERLRAVGQTFADGIAAFRERVTTRPRSEQEPQEKEAANVEVPIDPALRTAVGSDDMFPSAVTSRDGSQRKELDRLNSLLEASEARGDAIQEEAERLREENASLSSALDRSARLLNNLRSEYDRLRAETTERAGKGSAVVAETARLRSQAVDIERELQRMTSRADEADKRFVEERKKSAALERVCLGLRRRVAVAEDKAQDSRKMHDAILARELAEAQLAETKVDAERWRARSSAADVARERAEAAERSERIQREKIATLERELESREGLLRQGMHEKKKLQEYMSNYEKELERKEMKLARLRSWIKERGYQEDRPRRQRRRDDEIERALVSEDETDLGTGSLSIEKDLTDENDVTVSNAAHSVTKCRRH